MSIPNIDLESMKESSRERIVRLKGRVDESQAMAKSIEISLVDAGYMNGIEDFSAVGPQSGLRICNKLSFRGKQRAGEFFQFLDEDNDNHMKFEDFRGGDVLLCCTHITDNIAAMKSFTQQSNIFVHEPEFLCLDAWRLYMHDRGINVDDLGQVNKDNFVKFRESIEVNQSLTNDLQLFHLGTLPYHLQLWSDYKSLLGEVYTHRLSNNKEDASSEEGDKLTLEDVAFIFGNLNIIFDKSQLARLMLIRAPMQKLMETLLLKFLRTHFGSSPQRFAKMLGSGVIHDVDHTVQLADVQFVQANQLMAWLFANRPEPTCKGNIRQLIRWKYQFYRYNRRVDAWSKMVYDVGAHLRQRMIFRDFRTYKKLKNKEKEKQMVVFEAAIGGSAASSGDSTEGGLSFTWKMTKLDQPDDYCERLGLPRETGTAIVLDILLKHNDVDLSQCAGMSVKATAAYVEEFEKHQVEEVQHAADALKMFLRNHFESELRNNLQYRGTFVAPAVSEFDGAKVIRVSFVYKRLVSIDGFLEQMYVPYTFLDIVPDCSGEIKTNIMLYDFLTTTATSLDSSLEAKLYSRLSFRSCLAMPLLHRTFLALSAALSNAQGQPPANEHDKQDNNRFRALRSTFPPVSRHLCMGILLTLVQIVSWCKRIYKLLEAKKYTSWAFKFKNLSDLLTKAGFLSKWWRVHLTPEIGIKIGYIKEHFDAWVNGFKTELNEEFVRLKDYLEAKVVAEEKERRRVLMLSRTAMKKVEADQTNRTETMDKLRSLGVQVSSKDLFVDEPTTAESFVQYKEDVTVRQDIQAYITLERLSKVCLGLHSVEVVSGKAKLSGSFQGCDFVEFLPVMQSLVEVRDICNKKMKRTHTSDGDDK